MLLLDIKSELEAYAWAMIEKYDLHEEWTFRWNSRKNAFGLCNHTRKTIELSSYMVDCGESLESMKGTVLHEIAHALTPGDHHGPKWQAKILEFGLEPNAKRRAEGAVFEYKWYRVCNECGRKTGYHRKPSSKKRRSCGVCCPTHFNTKYELVVKKASELE